MDSAIRTFTSTRSDGDFAISGDPTILAANRRRIVDLPWVWLRQVHGSRVVIATVADADRVAGSEADAVVTTDAGVVLAVHTADCMPVVLWSPEGVLGAAHAGWRGLEAGVVERTVDAMRALGATDVQLGAGPVIGPECYEFGAAELDRLVERFGPSVRSSTTEGTPAFDLRAALRTVVAGLGVELRDELAECTSCRADRWFSYRARAEAGRMATLIWREPAQ